MWAMRACVSFRPQRLRNASRSSRLPPLRHGEAGPQGLPFAPTIGIGTRSRHSSRVLERGLRLAPADRHLCRFLFRQPTIRLGWHRGACGDPKVRDIYSRFIYKRLIAYNLSMGRRKKVSDDAVLAVARTVFAQRGHGASTRRIAELAGLSQAALFQRFGGKDRLFVAATNPGTLNSVEILGPIADATRQGGVGHCEEIAFRLHRQIAATVPQILQLAENPSLEIGVVDFAHERLGVNALLAALVARVTALQEMKLLNLQVEPGAVVEALLIGIHGLVFMRLVSPGSSSPELALQRFVRTLLGCGAQQMEQHQNPRSR